MMENPRLFIPGPVQVDRKVLEQLARPMIHHRSKECIAVISEIKQLLSELLQTSRDIFLLTSSASGAMEASIRNCVEKKVLCVANGEFGRRWHSIAVANGKDARLLDFGDGKPIDYAKVADELKKGYEAVTFVINETSTGMENDSKALKEAVRSVSDKILILADGVSAVFGTAVEVDDYDVLLFSTQKSLALPPGISIIIAGPEALERCRSVKNRGYYFDFLEMKRRSDENMTITTPALPILFALQYRLRLIKQQGIHDYIRQHSLKAEFVRSELAKLGFEPFVKQGYSKTLTVISNSIGIDVPKLMELLAGQGYIVENGYGPLKNRTFRISHMGDNSLEDTKRLMHELGKIVSSMRASA